MIVLPDAAGRLSPVRLEDRHSVRDFEDRMISIEAISQLLFSMQGRRRGEDKRLVPSAGAKYPLSLSIAVRSVSDLSAGFYRYDAGRHALELVKLDDAALAGVAAATFDAPWLATAAAVLHVSATFEKTTIPYASQPPVGRAERYVWLEAGHAAQNAALVSAALGLASVLVAGFDDEAMKIVFQLPATERPIAVMPVGYSREA